MTNYFVEKNYICKNLDDILLKIGNQVSEIKFGFLNEKRFPGIIDQVSKVKWLPERKKTRNQISKKD